MKNDELSETIRKMEKLIAEHDHNYYILNAPTISDHEYDSLLVELRDTVEKLGRDTSVVLSRPGSDRLGNLKEIRHRYPMLSIRTEVDSSAKPIERFISSCQKEFPEETPLKYTIECKYDGLAVSLRYDPVTGELQEAVTRGDGEIGEDITRSIDSIPNIRHRLSESCIGIHEVRGEIVMLKDKFDRANSIRENRGEKTFINTRNATAGIVRKLDPDHQLLELLAFIPYQAMMNDEGQLTSQSAIVRKLFLEFKDDRFNYYLPVSFSIDSADDLHYQYRIIEEERQRLNYDIDGVVYKLDSIELQRRFGVSGREPRWAIAHKFNPEVAATTLLEVDFQVGPSGRVTPVARIAPVFVGGTTVNNVTLSNIFRIREKNLRIGDAIKVRRAGDVIPEIVSNEFRNRIPYVKNIYVPINCPSCGSKITRQKGEVNSYCMNHYGCRDQFIASVERLGSRSVLNITGLGPAIGEALWECGASLPWVILHYTLSDLLDLGMSEVLTKKLFKEITSVRHTPMPVDKFILMLNIPSIGQRASRAIASHVGSFEGFLEHLDKLETIPKLSSLNIKEIRNFSKREVYLRHGDVYANILELAKEALSWFNVVNFESDLNGILSGKNITVTGSEPGISREIFKKVIQDHGAKLGSSVSKNTSIVVYGAGAGDKLTKAKSLLIPTMTYSEFLKEFPNIRL